MCAQLVVYPQCRPIFSTTLLGWLPVPYYTQHHCHSLLIRGGEGIPSLYTIYERSHVRPEVIGEWSGGWIYWFDGEISWSVLS